MRDGRDFHPYGGGRQGVPLADGIVSGGEQGGRGQTRMDRLSRVERLVVGLKVVTNARPIRERPYVTRKEIREWGAGSNASNDPLIEMHNKKSRHLSSMRQRSSSDHALGQSFRNCVIVVTSLIRHG
jgi:hypothetical protein